MKVAPYLNFNGQCREAFTFYEKCFGGKIEMMMSHGESPAAEQSPAEMQDKIMHVRLALGDFTLMGSDSPLGMGMALPSLYISLNVDSAADADRIFNELADKGKVQVPIDKTFWAERFGMVVDRFGIPWMVNYEKEQ